MKILHSKFVVCKYIKFLYNQFINIQITFWKCILRTYQEQCKFIRKETKSLCTQWPKYTCNWALNYILYLFTDLIIFYKIYILFTSDVLKKINLLFLSSLLVYRWVFTSSVGYESFFSVFNCGYCISSYIVHNNFWNLEFHLLSWRNVT